MLDQFTNTLHGIKLKTEQALEAVKANNNALAEPLLRSIVEDFAKNWLTDTKRLIKEGEDIRRGIEEKTITELQSSDT